MCVARESWLEDGEEEEKLLPLSDPALWGTLQGLPTSEGYFPALVG